MSEIRATFENADAAEWALLNLRGTGVAVTSYQLAPVSPRAGQGNLYPYNFTGAAGFRALNTGGYAPGPYDDTDVRRIYDIRSAEVELTVAVPDGQARRTRGYLISRHERQVRGTDSIP